MIKMMELCRDIGGELVVFGAAKNRKRGQLPLKKAMSIAADFFSDIAKTAEALGIYICFEPLSSEYDCDFIDLQESPA